VNVQGSAADLNQSLEKANRLADFLELGELMIEDALHREESCGCHLREEYMSPEGEAIRDDDQFLYVAAWEHKADGGWNLHKEPLKYENIKLVQRSYK
jgi:succinate dehydrogenase / fumarate reductase flavoprotein subunit